MFELDREVYCMKKVLSVSIKTIIFFVGWAICVSVIPIPDTASAVIWRFWAELIPLLSVIAITLIFWLADQKKIRLHLTGKPVYNIILGGVTGTIWLGASVGDIIYPRSCTDRGQKSNRYAVVVAACGFSQYRYAGNAGSRLFIPDDKK